MARIRRVDCSGPGIVRARHGRGFSYTDPAGQPVRDPDTLARVRALGIPPAWREVWICPLPTGHLQGLPDLERDRARGGGAGRLVGGGHVEDGQGPGHQPGRQGGRLLPRQTPRRCAAPPTSTPGVFDRYRSGLTIAGALTELADVDTGEPSHQGAIEAVVLDLIEEKRAPAFDLTA